ncbi:MAG: hypothetical protein ABIT58_11015 [Ferruginibacter sp.]
MKIFQSFIFILLLLVISCRSQETKNEQRKISSVDSNVQKIKSLSYFPVTNFIKGQIYEIRNGNSGVNPFKIIKTPGHTDSGWMKVESIDAYVADFLSVEIDSTNLTSVFTETKFMDQTLDAITFTYDPIKPLPDSAALRHWDIYINPNTGLVKSIYIVKKLPGNKIQQLNWVAGKSCNIKTIFEDSVGKPNIEKEITIKWAAK